MVGHTVLYRSHAKINLYLDVLNQRRDGYHNIETVFQTVGLADELEFEQQPAGITLECSNPELPCDASNLAHRAAALVQEHADCHKGVFIRLTKLIPLAAGLAGGSGNAAATLVALNELWGLRLSRGRLLRLAAALGADVPYCLVGGTVAATLRGECLTPLEPLPATWFVLVHPPVRVSTAWVYNHPQLARSTERPFAGRTRTFRKAIRSLQKGDLNHAVFNCMEDIVFAEYPVVQEARRRLLDAGCIAAGMSGSGPTVFGVCRSRDQAIHVTQRLSDVATSVVSCVSSCVERVA